MIDMELLILSVEKHQSVWNPHVEDYQNRDVKEAAWEEICRAMFSDWEDTVDKTKKLTDLKKKWYNIRDYYRKALIKNLNTNGSASKRQRRYVYADMLSFLETVYTQPSHEQIFPEFTDGEEGSPLEDQSAEYSEGQEDDFRKPLPEIKQESQKRVREDTVPGNIMNILQEYKKLNEEDESDAKFMLSFVSDMKKMNHKQKIDFKVGVTLLLQRSFEENFAIERLDD